MSLLFLDAYSVVSEYCKHNCVQFSNANRHFYNCDFLNAHPPPLDAYFSFGCPFFYGHINITVINQPTWNLSIYKDKLSIYKPLRPLMFAHCLPLPSLSPVQLDFLIIYLTPFIKIRSLKRQDLQVLVRRKCSCKLHLHCQKKNVKKKRSYEGVMRFVYKFVKFCWL